MNLFLPLTDADRDDLDLFHRDYAIAQAELLEEHFSLPRHEAEILAMQNVNRIRTMFRIGPLEWPLR